MNLIQAVLQPKFLIYKIFKLCQTFNLLVIIANIIFNTLKLDFFKFMIMIHWWSLILLIKKPLILSFFKFKSESEGTGFMLFNLILFYLFLLFWIFNWWISIYIFNPILLLLVAFRLLLFQFISLFRFFVARTIYSHCFTSISVHFWRSSKFH